MREGNIKLHWWIATLLVAWSSALPAAELRDPAVPNAANVIPVLQVPPGCPAAPVGNAVRAASLIVRNTLRPDVGPYRVTLPGYATDPAPNGDHYAPFVIEARPGDTLRVDLRNSLDASIAKDRDSVNLHMHGMVVSPSPPSGCSPQGDYVFKQTGKGFVTNYRFDIPAKLDGEVGLGQPYYPSGLYWFHSHVHGSARDQIQAGQAGLISITPGTDITDDPTALARAGARTRYMVLRDIQLAVPRGRAPNTPAAAGQTARWLSGDLYDTQACRRQSNPNVQMLSGPGFCGHTSVYDTNQKPVDSANDTVWLFTINGQHYPDVTIQPGDTELWRVANLSPTLTYTLELVDARDNEQDLQILTMDGVVTGTPQTGNSQTLRPGVHVKHVLLMPAARAEILVSNRALHPQDIVLTLRTQGLETSGKQNPSATRDKYSGDPWPPIDLARVVFKRVESPSAASDLLATNFSRASPLINPDRATKAAIPKNCVTLPSSQYRRRITFAQDDTVKLFMLGSEVVDRSGRSIDATAGAHPHTIVPEPFIHADPPELVRHICAQLGTLEVWELVNTTNELHNFHIHQTKFRLARANDPGAPPELRDTTVFMDPGKVLSTGQDLPELSQISAGSDVWHDTIPVPPQDARKNPGRVFVTIPFTDAHQVGTFVFHCHILEHEDSGMMATVQVFDPRHTASLVPGAGRLAELDRAAFCGNPPPGTIVTGPDYNVGRGNLLSSIYRVLAGVRAAAWK